MQKPQDKKKASLSPAAAKVLEQYRNAAQPAPGDTAGPTSDDQNVAQRPTSPLASQMRRSGTRGK